MQKTILSLLLSLFLSISAITPTIYAQDQAPPPPTINAKSAILMESTTGQILFEQNSEEALAPASVTKVMTLLLIYDSVKSGKISWDDKVTVSEHASSMGGSQIFLEPNEVQSVRDLTKSIAIASANDAAVAMAEYIGGSESGFVALMNERAKQLGMKNTTFQNACGLDTDNHLMSARDIAIMSRELITKHPEIREYTTKWQDTITHTTKKGAQEFGLTNTNKLIKLYNGATGLKTGSTGKALYCLSGTAERDGLSLIAVVMAAPEPKVRFQEVMKLLDYGFAGYSIEKGKSIGEYVGEVKVYKGSSDTVKAVVAKDSTILKKKGEDNSISTKLELIDGIKAPFDKGTKLGELIYYSSDKEISRVDVISELGIEKATLSDNIYKLFTRWVL